VKDLLAEFLPRFAASASDRLARVRLLLPARQLRELERELHTLAGEAAVLGLHTIADLARRGELAARGGESGDQSPSAWGLLLDEIERAVASAVAAGGEPG
jgi:HPt (histidine-containing phosphotransfer) domain-containing protein